MATTVKTVKLVNIVGDAYCTSSEDGEKVYKVIHDTIEEGKKVQLSFAGVEDLTSAFLNNAVGQLYGQYSEEEIRAHILPPVDATDEQLFLLKRVVDRAKAFFKEPERFNAAAKEVLGDDNGDEG